jgi:signal transduction histidine kinase
MMMSGIVLLTLTGTMISTMLVARHQLYSDGMRQASVRAQAFAYRAAFATLVAREAPETAKTLLQEVNAAPGTLGTELVDLAGLRLGAEERQPGALKACDFGTFDHRARQGALTYQVPGIWCVSMPIREGDSDSSMELNGALLGRLHVASDTSDAERALQNLVGTSIIVGLLLLGVGVFLVVRAASRVSTPLLEIVATMRASARGEPSARAPLRGPEEIVTISETYNRLMDSIDHQSAELEAQVEQRTAQLQVATTAAQSAERAKSAFLAVVGHEMKTPLHVIEANARDVLSELEFVPSADRAREHLGVILGQAGELALRLSQILALARADAGGYDVQREEFALSEFAEDVRQRAEPLARRNRNFFDQACTDRDMLLQIVTNLADNASKFTEAGRIRVTIRRLATNLEIEVADTGRGIPPAQQALVWQEFRQADMGEGRRFGGFGLGLAIVKRFTEMLGGDVDLTSEVGKGTRVRVRVPVVR